MCKTSQKVLDNKGVKSCVDLCPADSSLSQINVCTCDGYRDVDAKLNKCDYPVNIQYNYFKSLDILNIPQQVKDDFFNLAIEQESLIESGDIEPYLDYLKLIDFAFNLEL